jgi:hypothetical protein
MKTKITVGAVLLLTLGSAAGGMFYQKERSPTAADEAMMTAPAALDAQEVTPEMIAKWKATAGTADYTPAMLPI